MSNEQERHGLGRGRGRRSGPAALLIQASGHASLSTLAMDALGWPNCVLIAAKDGALIIKAGTEDDHRAYRLTWATEPVSGLRHNARLCARSAFKAAGMVPESGSLRYMALECVSDDGRPAVYIRKDQQIAVEPRTIRARVSSEVSA